jgi:hypothetical protein
MAEKTTVIKKIKSILNEEHDGYMEFPFNKILSDREKGKIIKEEYAKFCKKQEQPYEKVKAFPKILIEIIGIEDLSNRTNNDKAKIRTFEKKTGLNRKLIYKCEKNPKHKPIPRTIFSIYRGMQLSKTDLENMLKTAYEPIEDDVYKRYMFLVDISSHQGYIDLLKEHGGNIIITDNYILEAIGTDKKHFLGGHN